MHIIKHAVVIFVDVRGFTSFSQHADVFQYLEEFLSDCYSSILKIFDGAFIKTLGDGAMIIEECAVPQTQDEVTHLLASILLRICQIEGHFRATCDRFTIQHGHTTTLRLGWGIVRGIVNVLSREDLGVIDYIGPSVNKTARLCSLARPGGIVIDREDFPVIPALPDGTWPVAFSAMQRTFLPEEHRVNGISEPLPVWTLLTMEGRIMAPDPLREE